VGGLVVVCSPEGSRALDLQSVVCSQDRNVIGVIADTFGPVIQPFYLVYPTCRHENYPTVGSQVFAAVSLNETSYLCDTASPFDLQEIRRSLLGEAGEAGESGDEGDEDVDDQEDDEERTKDELERKLLDDIGPEGMLARAMDEQEVLKSRRKGKGKGKGKVGKGKGNKGTKNRNVEPKVFPKDEREGVWGEPEKRDEYGVADVKEEIDEKRQNGFCVKDENATSHKPTRWKLWGGKRPAGGAPPPPPPAPPVPPPPPQDSRISSLPAAPAPPPPAPPAPPVAFTSYEDHKSSTPSRQQQQSTRLGKSRYVASRQNQTSVEHKAIDRFLDQRSSHPIVARSVGSSGRRRAGPYGNDVQTSILGGWNDARAERQTPPPPPGPPPPPPGLPSPGSAPSSAHGWTPSASSRSSVDAAVSRPGDRRPRRQSNDRPFKQSRSSTDNSAQSASLPPPPPLPPSASQSSSQRAYGGQRGTPSNGRGSVEETTPWRR